MLETSKASKRRYSENWPRYFAGQGIDVGSGNDPLDIPGTIWFDKTSGDAERLLDYYEYNTFDWLHSSQCLEHLNNPVIVFREWIQVVKPGGYLIITVPSWELYEKETWPSMFNTDHKSTWSVRCKTSPALWHIYVPEFLAKLSVHVCLLRELSTNYDYSLPKTVDQTLDPLAGVEPFIEFVVKRIC